MKPPRFTLRFLLVIVTIAAVGFGICRTLFVKRSVSVKETEAVAVEMSTWQVRWQLGAPHQAWNGTANGQFFYQFEFGRSEN